MTLLLVICGPEVLADVFGVPVTRLHSMVEIVIKVLRICTVHSESGCHNGPLSFLQIEVFTLEQSDSASLGAALRAAHAHRCAEGRVLEGDELPGIGSVWGDPMNLWILWCSSLISEKETCHDVSNYCALWNQFRES